MAAQDPIDRMCEKHFVKPGSPLERTARAFAFKFFGSDGTLLEERFDAFIAEYRQNKFYNDSFTATPPARVAGIDIHISEELRTAIADGSLVVQGADRDTASVPATVRPNSEEELAAIASNGKVG
jgi:hypothetical protein